LGNYFYFRAKASSPRVRANELTDTRFLSAHILKLEKT
jgi:hypothetical protein